LRAERRVQGFIALSTPGNHLEDIARQLHTFIEDLDPRLDLHMSEPLDVSASLVQGTVKRSGFLADMAGRLRVALGGDWGESLQEVLAPRAPPRTPKRHRILWLDWRVLRGRVKDDVSGWMDFCSDHLAPALPQGVDVVVTIALEVTASHSDALQAALEMLSNDPTHRTDQVRFTVLPPLGKAPLGEVLQFLDDTQCPQGLRHEIARLLGTATGGDYNSLREWIERALASTWGEVARDLRQISDKVGVDDGL
jgi:hypothetical protein